jgi:F0F1-type ATP synthase assembly protein I
MAETPPTKLQRNAQWLEASSLGWMFPIALALGFGAGYGLDKLFGTKPWLTIIFSVFGLAAAFINLFRIGLSGSNDYVPPATDAASGAAGTDPAGPSVADLARDPADDWGDDSGR